MWKKCKVVMLPTNQKSLIGLSGKKLYNLSPYHQNQDIEIGHKDYPVDFQHLYFLSEDEIKEGDFYLWINNKQICRAESDLEILNNHLKNGDIKKIIATTDTSLIEGIRWSKEFSLPQPHKSFIKEFIRQYNDGNTITEVLVEYDLFWNNRRFKHQPFPDEFATEKDRVYDLHINSDNTINTKSLKNSWTREEVEDLCVAAFYHKDLNQGLPYDYTDERLDNWIKINLP